MTNGTAVENFSRPGNKMGSYHKGRIYVNRNSNNNNSSSHNNNNGSHYYKNSNSPTKNMCQQQQNENNVCDKSKLRPKSSEPFVILMPNPARHGTPKVKMATSPRASPSKEGGGGHGFGSGCIRSSPTVGGHYAGAKFCEPPAPNSLPKPPLHWTSLMLSPSLGGVREKMDKSHDASHQLKILLNVQA